MSDSSSSSSSPSSSFTIEFLLDPSGPSMDCYCKPIRITFEKPKNEEERQRMVNALRKLSTTPNPARGRQPNEREIERSQILTEEDFNNNDPQDLRKPLETEGFVVQKASITYGNFDEDSCFFSGMDSSSSSSSSSSSFSSFQGKANVSYAYSESDDGPSMHSGGQITRNGFFEDNSVSPENSSFFSVSSNYGPSPLFNCDSVGALSLPVVPPLSCEVNIDVVNDLITQLVQIVYSLRKPNSHGAPRNAFSHQKLASACDDFKYLGLSYCTTAIREIGLQEEWKTLKISPDAGGTAGGAKMVCINCIRLKNPERCKLPKQYGDCTYKAQKSAKHEFHYSDMMFEASLSKKSPSGYIVIPAPCMLINYLGHEFLVSLNLPLDSRVAGRSGTDTKPFIIDDKDIPVIEFLNKFLQPLGLEKHGASHCYGDCTHYVLPPKHFSALPWDAEVYRSMFQIKGYDPLYFVVDTARMMPPGFDSSIKTDYPPFLFRHMRKEFVQWYYVEVLKKESGLSCDAFSASSLPDDNEKVKRAYQVYLSRVPRTVAEHLAKLECVVFSDDLVRIVHYFGLNLRDLGLVYYELDKMEKEKKKESNYCGAWKHRIIVEIIARSFRRVVDRILFLFSSKPNSSFKESDIKKKMAGLFNAALWVKDSMHSKIWERIRVWKDECFGSLRSSFGEPVSVDVSDILIEESGYLLESFLWVSSNLLGVKWTLALWNNRCNPKFFMNPIKRPFDIQDVKEVQPRVLELNMAHHAHGIALCELSQEDRESNLETIIHCFQDALDRQPTNVHTMDRLARSYRNLADFLEKRKNEADKERIRILRRRAEYLVEMASKVPDCDMDSLFAYGLDLMKKNCMCRNETEKNELEKARDLFAEAMKNGHRHSRVMLSDILYFCLKRPMEEVLEPLEVFDGSNGCNAGFHRFVHSLESGDLETAVDIACKIRRDPIIDVSSPPDKKRLDDIQRLQDVLLMCLF